MLQCVAVCCSVLQCVAVCRSVLQHCSVCIKCRESDVSREFGYLHDSCEGYLLERDRIVLCVQS